MVRFILGVIIGFGVGWFVLEEPAEPDLTRAELIEVELLNQ